LLALSLRIRGVVVGAEERADVAFCAVRANLRELRVRVLGRWSAVAGPGHVE